MNAVVSVASVSLSVVCDQVDQVVPAHQVDDIDEVHELDPVHQVDHIDEFHFCFEIINCWRPLWSGTSFLLRNHYFLSPLGDILGSRGPEKALGHPTGTQHVACCVPDCVQPDCVLRLRPRLRVP